MSATTAAPAHGRVHIYSKTSLLLIAVCFILSGATGLIYEVLWARMLGLVFGATTFAVSTVLAAFMGGLALGSAWAGRLAGKIKRPLRVYGVMEICIALYALAVPLLFRLADYFYALIWSRFSPGFYTFSLWRFALSCAVLLVPTMLMGATLPVLAAALLRSPTHTQTAVARLYAYNLTGAIAGTIIAGFLLLPNYGVRATIYTAAAINIIIGLAALLIDRRSKTVEKGSLEDVEKRAATTTGDVDKFVASRTDELAKAASGPSLQGDEIETLSNSGVVSEKSLDEGQGKAKFWLLCAVVSGFVTISTQVAWTRMLTMIIGSSTYAFSIVLALFLTGLFGGALLVGRRKKYGANALRRLVMIVELVTAASLFLSIWAANLTPSLLISAGLNLQINSWPGLLALQICAAALLILVPALLMGMVMPLVLVWAGGAGGAGAAVRLVGRSYALNTLGAIAGAFLTGFILIPKASTRFTILFAASLCVMVAGVAYRPSSDVADKDLRRGLAAGAAFALVLAMFALAPYLNLSALSVGAYDSLVRVLARTRVTGNDETQTGPETHQLLMYKEGPTATVTVRKDWAITSLAINGRTNASDNKDDMATQTIVGQLPLLLAPRTDNGLVIGLASGVSTGAMLQSSIGTLDCVELEPATIESSRFFEHVNHQPLADPRLRLMIDDARTYLRVNPARYDMIVSEPSHPWVPGVANLFTREFFELGRSRLQGDGVFVQWLQIYQLSTESLRSVLATYTSVFPHVLMFRVGGAKGKDLILVGSRAPLSLARVPERMSDPRIAAELARININSPDDLKAWYICDETQLLPAIQGAIINTDDNMHIENRAPREAFLPLMESNAAWIETLATQARNAGSKL